MKIVTKVRTPFISSILAFIARPPRRNDSAYRTVAIPAAVLSIFYLLLSLLHQAYLTGTASWVMSITAFLSSCAFFACLIVYRRLQRSLNSDVVLAVMACIVLLNCTIHIWSEQVFGNTINFIIYSLGIGFVITNSAWFYSLLAAGIASWGFAVFSLGLSAGSSELEWLFIFSQAGAILLHHLRRNSELSNQKLADTLKSHADALNSLVKAPELANSEFDSMLSRIVKVASDVLEVDTVSIWFYDNECELIRCEQVYSQSLRQVPKGTEISKLQGPRYFEAIQSYRVIDAVDALADPRTQDLADYLETNAISSMMDLPIIIRGSLWGVICLEHKGVKREWSLQEQSFGTSLADIAALTIQGHQHSMLERRTSQSERLESMGVLAGGVAHDFNNLLTVILGHAELIGLKSNSNDIQPNLEAILNASERARELAQQMLAYSGRATFLAKDYDLSTLVEELEETWAQHLLQSVELELELQATPLYVQGDVTQIRQIISNLLTNARDAGATKIVVTTGEAKLSDISSPLVDVPELDSGQRFAFVEVSDNGAGMAKETRERIFDPFFTTKSYGSGLGLAATLGIVRAHNGTIELSSEPETGSTFRIYLPQLDEAMTCCAAVEPSAESGKLGLQEHLVVVEDEEDIASLACEFLADKFKQTSCYDSFNAANEAISEMNLNHVSVMLVDLSLGDGDGVELIQNVKERRDDIPIVLMSGFDAEEALSRMAREHGVQFLHKPFSKQQMLQCIEQVVIANKPC